MCVCVCVRVHVFVCMCVCVCGCMYKQGKEQGCIEGFSLWVGRMLHAEACVPPGKCVSSNSTRSVPTIQGLQPVHNLYHTLTAIAIQELQSDHP